MHDELGHAVEVDTAVQDTVRLHIVVDDRRKLAAEPEGTAAGAADKLGLENTVPLVDAAEFENTGLAVDKIEPEDTAGSAADKLGVGSVAHDGDVGEFENTALAAGRVEPAYIALAADKLAFGDIVGPAADRAESEDIAGLVADIAEERHESTGRSVRTVEVLDMVAAGIAEPVDIGLADMAEAVGIDEVAGFDKATEWPWPKVLLPRF